MRITVNGRDYDSWDDVPADQRAALAAAGVFADSDHDGVPDVFERETATGTPSAQVRAVTTKITVDGRTYDSPDDLPAPVREQLRAAGLLPADQPVEVEHAADPPAGRVQAAEGRMVLNGVPVEDRPRRKRWWRR